MDQPHEVPRDQQEDNEPDSFAASLRSDDKHRQKGCEDRGRNPNGQVDQRPALIGAERLPLPRGIHAAILLQKGVCACQPPSKRPARQKREGKSPLRYTAVPGRLLDYWTIFVLCPRAKRVFLWHSAALQTVAEALIQKRPPEDISGLALPRDLSGSQIRRIKVVDDCVIFSLDGRDRE